MHNFRGLDDKPLFNFSRCQKSFSLKWNDYSSNVSKYILDCSGRKLLIYPWTRALARAWRGVWPAASWADVSGDSSGQQWSPPSLVTTSHDVSLTLTSNRRMEGKILSSHGHAMSIVFISISGCLSTIIQHFICLSATLFCSWFKVHHICWVTVQRCRDNKIVSMGKLVQSCDVCDDVCDVCNGGSMTWSQMLMTVVMCCW